MNLLVLYTAFVNLSIYLLEFFEKILKNFLLNRFLFVYTVFLLRKTEVDFE